MITTAEKTESIEVKIDIKRVLREILTLTSPIFSHDVMIEEGKVYFYERSGWNDYDWKERRIATEEEIELYNAYLLLSNKAIDK